MSDRPQANTSATVNDMTQFQGHLLLLKSRLEAAKRSLTPREWAALRACLHIYLTAEDEKAG